MVDMICHSKLLLHLFNMRFQLLSDNNVYERNLTKLIIALKHFIQDSHRDQVGWPYSFNTETT